MSIYHMIEGNTLTFHHEGYDEPIEEHDLDVFQENLRYFVNNLLGSYDKNNHYKIDDDYRT